MWPDPLESAVWSHLLKKSLMENLIFRAMYYSVCSSFMEEDEIVYKFISSISLICKFPFYQSCTRVAETSKKLW